MRRSDDVGEQVRMILNLWYREIEIRFPSVVNSERSGAMTREFRFRIALDDTFNIWKITEGYDTSLIIHLQNPPWYSKKLEQKTAQSHVPGGKRWSADDLWARQTDIVDRKELFESIDKTPVSVRKNLNVINVARWTTYRLRIRSDEDNKLAEGVVLAALRDFNVNIVEMDNFGILPYLQDTEAPVWKLLNPTIVNGTSTNLSALQDELAGIYLPFSVRYQLEVCISHGWLSEYSIDSDFLQTLASLPEQKAKQMLILVDSTKERIHNPTLIFKDLRFKRPVKPRRLPPGCAEIYHATVTATGLLFHTPSVEVTNRVVRRYASHIDRFLRVSFEDDSYRGKTKLFAAANGKMKNIFERVRRVMRNGIVLGDRTWTFLAYGNSQLREHGAYFFAATADGLNAQKIRASMGEFDNERVVAKRAARIGQCFSTTKPIHLRLPLITKANLIPDIKNEKGHIFTDGVGKISRLAAGITQSQLGITGPTPSVFQFRLGGCKGVLALDPQLAGVDVKIRNSQFKFNSLSGELEIIRWSEFWQATLNRQLITVFSHLGVPDDVFLLKQDITIKTLNQALKDDRVAIRGLRDTVDPNRMTLVIADLVCDGFRARSEPFVTALLHLWRAWSLKYLKEKARIPVSAGAFVLGCVDETGTLKGDCVTNRADLGGAFEAKMEALPEVFIQITDPQSGKVRVIEETCVIARNPSLHPGDIRVVKAVNVQALHHLRDVLVMPQQGERDLPSMCSGGDLDGDDYVVIWDKELIPTTWNVEPFHYNPPTPVTATGEITTDHIINFFVDYLQNDYLGRIATAHVGAADGELEGIASPECLELCQLHSLAVDYPKTGVKAELPQNLVRTQWPHFMERRGRRNYISKHVLGLLYDAVERANFVPDYDLPFDARILRHSQSREMRKMAEDLKQEYDIALQRIMAQHQISTEFEVWSTFVLDHSKASRDFRFHEEIGQLSKTLKDTYFDAIVAAVGGRDFGHLAPFAVEAYRLTQEQVSSALREIGEGTRTRDPSSMPFISFPWLLHHVLGKIASSENLPLDREIKTENVKQSNNTDKETGVAVQTEDSSGLLMHRFAEHPPDPYQPGKDLEKDDDFEIEGPSAPTASTVGGHMPASNTADEPCLTPSLDTDAPESTTPPAEIINTEQLIDVSDVAWVPPSLTNSLVDITALPSPLSSQVQSLANSELSFLEEKSADCVLPTMPLGPTLQLLSTNIPREQPQDSRSPVERYVMVDGEQIYVSKNRRARSSASSQSGGDRRGSMQGSVGSAGGLSPLQENGRVQESQQQGSCKNDLSTSVAEQDSKKGIMMADPWTMTDEQLREAGILDDDDDL